jgi:hypothetical protein
MWLHVPEVPMRSRPLMTIRWLRNGSNCFRTGDGVKSVSPPLGGSHEGGYMPFSVK